MGQYDVPACKYDIQHCMIQNEELTDLSESVVAVVEEWQGWIRGKITAMQRPRNVVPDRSKSRSNSNKFKTRK
jgi:hypothetical protein